MYQWQEEKEVRTPLGNSALTEVDMNVYILPSFLSLGYIMYICYITYVYSQRIKTASSQ